MNQLAMTLIAVSLAVATPVFADDAHHPEKEQQAALSSPAKPALPAPVSVKKMQDNVKKMQSQLERIGKTKDDVERQKLVAEHMQTMRENMMAAKGMMGDGMGCQMMKEMKDGMGMMPPGGGADAQPMMQRMQQMEKRMDMMQMMMERMPAPPAK